MVSAFPSRPPAWGTALLLAGVGLRLLISGRIYPLSNPLFLIFFAALLLLRPPGRRQGLWLPPSLEFFLFLFFAGAAVSIPLGILPRGGYDEMLTWLSHLFMVLALLRWLTPDLVPPAAGVLVCAGLLSAALALRQYFGGFASTLEIAQPLDPYILQTLKLRRVFGLTFSPDLFAGLMALLIPLSLALAGEIRRQLQPRSLPRTLLLLTPGFIMLVALLLTRSLGGVLAAGAGGLVLFAAAFHLLPPPGRKAAVTLLLLALAVGGLWIGTSRGHELFHFQHPANPLRLRLDNWNTALAVAGEKPFWGVGLGNFGLAYLAHRTPSGNEVQDAHNCFLQVWAETGLMGLFGWTGVALYFLLRGWRLARHGQWLPAGILAGGFAFLAHAGIDFDLYVPEIAGAWWALLALQAVLTGRPDLPRGKALRWTLAGIITSVILAGAWWFADLHLIQQAQQAMTQAKFQEAADLWKRARRLDPHNDLLPARLAQSLARARPWDAYTTGEIIRSYRLAQALNPRQPFHHRDLAEFYLLRGWPEEAEKEYRQALALYPNSYSLNLELGRLLRAAAQWSEAEARLRQAEQCSPFNSAAVLEQALILSATGRPQAAEQLMEKHVRERPGIIHSWQALAEFRSGRQEWDQAEAAYAEMVTRWPERREGYLGLARVAAQQGDPNRARAYLEELLRLYPQDPEARRLYQALSSPPHPTSP